MALNLNIKGVDYHIQTLKNRRSGKRDNLKINVFLGKPEEITRTSVPLLEWEELQRTLPKDIKSNCIQSIMNYRGGNTTRVKRS